MGKHRRSPTVQRAARCRTTAGASSRPDQRGQEILSAGSHAVHRDDGKTGDAGAWATNLPTTENDGGGNPQNRMRARAGIQDSPASPQRRPAMYLQSRDGDGWAPRLFHAVVLQVTAASGHLSPACTSA